MGPLNCKVCRATFTSLFVCTTVQRGQKVVSEFVQPAAHPALLSVYIQRNSKCLVVPATLLFVGLPYLAMVKKSEIRSCDLHP